MMRKPIGEGQMNIKCKFDVMMDIRELKSKFNPKNPNEHPEDQIEEIIKIFKYQGIRSPARISNLSDLLTAGHGRILSAEKMGLTEYPVEYQDYDSEEQEYADMVADNALQKWAILNIGKVNTEIGSLGPDFDIDLLGIKDFVVEVADKLPPGCNEDEVPAHVEPRSHLGDVYSLGIHRLMCGDSTSIDAVEMLMNGEKADMVFTDPPYGVDAVGGDKAVGGGKIVKSNRYSRIIGDLSTDTAKDSIALVMGLGIEKQVWFGANNYSHSLPESNGWLYWQKNQTGDFADGELAWTSSKGSIKRFEHTWAGLIKASEHGDKRCHPTQKPVALAEWCFETYAKESKSVLDLFGGSGSTLIACEKTNRRCFMMELDPHYCDVIVARWEKYTGKKAELVNGQA